MIRAVAFAAAFGSIVFAATAPVACEGCASAPPPNAASTVTIDATVCVLTHYSDSADVVASECAPVSSADALKILDAANAMSIRKAAGMKSVQP